EVQAQAGGGQQLVVQAETMGEQGDDAEQGQQALVRRQALGQAQALVGGGTGIQAGGREAGQQRVHNSLLGEPERARVWHKRGGRKSGRPSRLVSFRQACAS